MKFLPSKIWYKVFYLYPFPNMPYLPNFQKNMLYQFYLCLASVKVPSIRIFSIGSLNGKQCLLEGHPGFFINIFVCKSTNILEFTFHKGMHSIMKERSDFLKNMHLG